MNQFLEAMVDLETRVREMEEQAGRSAAAVELAAKVLMALAPVLAEQRDRSILEALTTHSSLPCQKNSEAKPL